MNTPSIHQSCVLPRGHCCCCLLVRPCSDNASTLHPSINPTLSLQPTQPPTAQPRTHRQTGNLSPSIHLPIQLINELPPSTNQRTRTQRLHHPGPTEAESEHLAAVNRLLADCPALEDCWLGFVNNQTLMVCGLPPPPPPPSSSCCFICPLFAPPYCLLVASRALCWLVCLLCFSL
jgi:hypothetical protein